MSLVMMSIVTSFVFGEKKETQEDREQETK